MDEPKVVVYTSKRRFLPSKRVLLVVLAGMLMIGAGTGLAFIQKKKETLVRRDTYGPLEERLPATVVEAQNLAVSGDYAQADKKIQEGLSAPGVSTEQKYILITQEGINLQNQGQYKEAHQSYLAAEVIKQEYKISRLIADNASIMGDKVTALKYYKKALAQLNKNSPLYQSDKSYVEAQLKELEG